MLVVVVVIVLAAAAAIVTRQLVKLTYPRELHLLLPNKLTQQQMARGHSTRYCVDNGHKNPLFIIECTFCILE